MKNKGISRRGFLKFMAISGVSVYLAPLYSHAYEALFTEKILETPVWDPNTKRVKFRIDGVAKVTGNKVFAMDIRSRDLPHWPQQQAHAFIIRVTEADKIYEGFDISRLQGDLVPDRIVTAADLEKDGIDFPSFYGKDMLLPVGSTPAYLGQAVAILIYNDFARFKYAKDALKFKNDIIQYGAYTGYLKRDPWQSYRGVRIGSTDPFAEDTYSSLKDGRLFPTGFKDNWPIWPNADKEGTPNERGMYYAQELAETFENAPEDWLVLNRQYNTSSTDVTPMEADNTNGWYDPETETMHLVTGTQSPIEVVQSTVEMFSKSNIPLKRMILHPCSTVGYGAKEHSTFPFYGVVASIYAGGVPVRLACDRFEHFQAALKRHAFDMDYTLAINKNTQKIEAFIGKFIGDGGARANFTTGVMQVGPIGSQAGYYIPKTDLTAVGIASRAIDAGSARGYGTLQTMAAMDTMMDEAASILGADPIEFRLKNMLQSGMKNSQGVVPAGKIRLQEVLTACSEHPIWTEREARQAQYERDNPGKLFATGISCVQKAFGTGAEAVFARIELSPEGKIVLYHSGPEIGTGMSTTQAILCARWLGEPAAESHFAITEWDILPMYETINARVVTQEQQDTLQQDPLWTPTYCSPSSASNSAFYYSHGTVEGTRLLFDYGLWPAALSIWKEGAAGGQAAPFYVRKDDAKWTADGLTANGMEPLSLERLIKRTYQLGGLTGVVVHGFNRWQWAEADFMINGEVSRRALDGMSLRFGTDPYSVNKRIAAYYPETRRTAGAPTNYSAFATAVELSIDTHTGKVSVLNHHSVSECGKVMVPELVSGQIQGGVAMGIGHALYEYLPLYEDGPGNGTWNFNRYHLPRASEVAVWAQTSEVLPPVSSTDPSKGMAEVVMIPVVSAITNAIATRTGHYLKSYPILPEQVLEVLKNENRV